MTKYLILTIISLIAALGAGAQETPDSTLLQRRASTFFDQREWLNAAVTYERLTRLQPDSPAIYGRGIAAAGMADEPDIQLRLTRTAMEHGVIVDSLFNAVRAATFSIGHSNLYEAYIIRTAAAYPWMSRIANVRLLDLYDFRSDGPQMVRYALRLLSASPNSVPMLTILARGYLLQAEYTQAVSVYNRILTLEPHNLNALLTLGNYYVDLADRLRHAHDNHNIAPLSDIRDARAATDRAIHYLTQANELYPTPHLAALLHTLRGK